MNQSVGVYCVLFAKLSTYPKKEKRKKSWPLTPTHKTKVQRYAPDSKVKTRPQCLASKHKHICYNQLQTHRHCSSFKTHSPLLLLWLPSISPTIKPSFQLLQLFYNVIILRLFVVAQICSNFEFASSKTMSFSRLGRSLSRSSRSRVCFFSLSLSLAFCLVCLF